MTLAAQRNKFTHNRLLACCAVKSRRVVINEIFEYIETMIITKNQDIPHASRCHRKRKQNYTSFSTYFNIDFNLKNENEIVEQTWCNSTTSRIFAFLTKLFYKNNKRKCYIYKGFKYHIKYCCLFFLLFVACCFPINLINLNTNHFAIVFLVRLASEWRTAR